MFSKTIIDSDLFIDMPTSTRLLYFDLSMRADDDGFVNSPKKIIRMTGASQDDLRLLIVKNFLIPFESGVVVIKHWKIHNYIRNDRYKPTICQDEMAQLSEDKNKEYVVGIPMVDQMETQVRLGEDRIELGKDRIKDNEQPTSPKKEKPVKHKYGEYQHVMLTDEEKDKLITEHGEEDTLKAIKRLDEYIEETGKKYKNHNLTLRRWVFDAIKEKPKSKPQQSSDERTYHMVDDSDILDGLF